MTGPSIKNGRGQRQGAPLPLQQMLELTTKKGILHKIRGKGTMVRTPLYVDDVAIFMAPIEGDIDSRASILRGFGEITGLCTNF